MDKNIQHRSTITFEYFHRDWVMGLSIHRWILWLYLATLINWLKPQNRVFQVDQCTANKLENSFPRNIIQVFLFRLDIPFSGDWSWWTIKRNVSGWVFLSLDKCNSMYI